jgi:AraC-like DNA-binding protein
MEFFRYFPISPRDRQWGIYVTGLGSTHVPPFTPSYPMSMHPATYMYTWENGRVLGEYQALYIARGQGQFESRRTGMVAVEPGSVILLLPGEWHRYRPNQESGWDEYWVSFGGPHIDDLAQAGFFSPQEPVLHTGADETIQHAYLDLLDRAQMEPIGYQQLNAASVPEILAACLAAVRRRRQGNHGEDLVRKAKAAMEQRVEGTLAIDELAAALGLSAEHLRRLFRQHTGMAPYQYYLERKIHRARQLLQETDLPIKSIARLLGFESPFHFAKAFKQRTDVSPTQWRRGEVRRGPGPA